MFNQQRGESGAHAGSGLAVQGAEMRGSGTGVMVRMHGQAGLPGARRTRVGRDSRLGPRQGSGGGSGLEPPEPGPPAGLPGVSRSSSVL